MHRVGAVAVACVAVLLVAILFATPSSQPKRSVPDSVRSSTMEGITTVITDRRGWLATFTLGSRTVTVRGPKRLLSEPDVVATISDDIYVRLLPDPFDGRVDRRWLARAVADRSPDILATALQYTTGAPRTRNAGDAGFEFGADFNDYLETDWRHGRFVEKPKPGLARTLDCSGFLRIVFGYRNGMPMTVTTAGGNRLPRSANLMAEHGPGVIIATTRDAALTALRPGDVAFFNLYPPAVDARIIDHSGIYLGRDQFGHWRFVSSRRSTNGPSMGDAGPDSIVDGNGAHAQDFRLARRF